ncbi:MAG: amidohydrolase family protein [Bacteroidota bacterium]
MPTLFADAIYHPAGWIHDQGLVLSKRGEVLGWEKHAKGSEAKRVPGILVPGWVNAHCHLELSAFGGKVLEQVGMTGFIRSLFTLRRNIGEWAQQEAVTQAMQRMHEQGTAAVGDISNGLISLAAKQATPLATHTFVEILGLDPAEATTRLEAGKKVQAGFNGLRTSLTPHAPYSTSTQLFQAIYQENQGPISIHLAESQEEWQLFTQANGAFRDFYRELGIYFQPFDTQDPLDHALKNLPKEVKALLVHLTEVSPERFAHLRETFPLAWFCLCPRSNWYLHRRLPPIAELSPELRQRICLGTDSAASNYSLDLWEEVVFLLNRFPSLSLHEVLRWATTQGAEALGFEDHLGQFMVGKRPGILCLEGLNKIQDGFSLGPQSRVRVLHEASLS